MDGELETADDTGTFFPNDLYGEYIAQWDSTSPNQAKAKVTSDASQQQKRIVSQIKGGHVFKRLMQNEAEQPGAGTSRNKEAEWRKSIDVVEFPSCQSHEVA